MTPAAMVKETVSIMSKTRILLCAFTLGFAVIAGSGQGALAAEQQDAKDIRFSFEGPFSTFDRAQLQRGFQVYKETCASCHGMDYMHYRNLGQRGGPEFPPEQVEAIAAQYTVTDGPDESGDYFERPAIPSDRFVNPFPNEQAARAANNGAMPTDLSLITKAREGWHGTIRHLLRGIGGPQYVYSVLTGYSDPPAELADRMPAGTSYNPYFAAGPWISMPPPLVVDMVEYQDGTPATVDQMARDVTAFLTWAAEPKMEERKSLGFKVLAFMVILTVLLYLTKRKIWARIEH